MGNTPSPDHTDFVLQQNFQSLAELLSAAADAFRDREAYIEGEKRLTYGDWVRTADGLASGLAERGIGPGDVVAIWLPSSIDFAICYAAIARLGAIVTGINTRLGPREISAILDTSETKLVIAEDGASLPPTRKGPQVVRRSELAGHFKKAPHTTDHANILKRSPAAIIWTSGTTGLPKGAWFDHAGLEATAKMAGPMAAPFDCRLLPTPFSHGGYMTKVWEQAVYGLKYVIGPVPWTAQETLDMIVRERVTMVSAVPTQWEKLVRLPGLEQADLSSIRLCITATAPAAPELVENVTKLFRSPLVSRYAMTESPSVTGTAPGDPPDVLYRTVGQPHKGVTVTIVDENGRPLPVGQVGRLQIKSECAMRGYWNAPELTAEAINADGWLVSSDMGYFDKAGNLILAGRAGDMYIRGGYNVYPLEVENVLMEHPGVSAAAIIGVKTPVIGEIGVAFIVPADPAHPPDTDDLRDWCGRTLADYKRPDEIRFVDRLPQTAMMKIDKTALRQSYEAKTDG